MGSNRRVDPLAVQRPNLMAPGEGGRWLRHGPPNPMMTEGRPPMRCGEFILRMSVRDSTAHSESSRVSRTKMFGPGNP